MLSNHKLSIFSLLLFYTIIFYACATPITYRYDRDKSVPIQDYSTYRVIKPTEEILDQMEERYPEYLPIVEESIIQEMENRGYTQSDDAELLITYFVSGKNFQKAQSNTVSVGVGFGGPYGGVGMSQGKTNINYIDYRQGTLMIDFYNKDKEMIWHGVAEGSYEIDKTDVDDLTRKVVKRIFQYYKYKANTP